MAVQRADPDDPLHRAAAATGALPSGLDAPTLPPSGGGARGTSSRVSTGSLYRGLLGGQTRSRLGTSGSAASLGSWRGASADVDAAVHAAAVVALRLGFGSRRRGFAGADPAATGKQQQLRQAQEREERRAERAAAGPFGGGLEASGCFGASSYPGRPGTGGAAGGGGGGGAGAAMRPRHGFANRAVSPPFGSSAPVRSQRSSLEYDPVLGRLPSPFGSLPAGAVV